MLAKKVHRPVAKSIRSRTRRLNFERLDSRFALAGDTVTIYAAGHTGEESMQLLIDGVAVQSWDNIGGNHQNRTFQVFTYTAASTLSPDRIRVAFTNDLYLPPTIDRNLVVDRIQINDTTYETEAPTVYSTGTYRPEDGIQPGFRLSEDLNANGYFQYALLSGSVIQILAAGTTGNENIELQIDGRTVAGWNQITGNVATRQWSEFTYQASSIVNASQIRVAFTNDFYSPPIDYNVAIDKIIIDGVEYETEAPSTLSTGSFIAAQNGVVTGYWQTEGLQANGYFQYESKPLNPGVFGLESSVYDVLENAGSVSVSIVRSGGSDGTASLSYRTFSGTALNGSDYSNRLGTIAFLNGETRKTITIPLLNDSFREAPETFSFVIENPIGGATLLAPRTATITITDDDLLLPNYSSFPNSLGLRLNRSASITSGTLQLTPSFRSQTGSAFYDSPIPINVDTSFATQFQFRTTGSTNGGDGFTFTIQNSTAGASAIGGGGGALGYLGIARSFAIEFDTYQNGGEISNNHVSFWRDGNMVNSLLTRSSTIDFNGGGQVFVWVDYNGDSDILTMYLGTTNVKPTNAFASVALNLPAIVGGQAYFGFTAATGGAWNGHQIQNFKLNLNRLSGSPPNPVQNLVQQTVVSGLNQPTAAQFSLDGRNLYIAQKEGVVRIMRDGLLLSTSFIDISNQVNNASDRGLLDIALHPNFASNPYIYLLFTYDPPEVFQNSASSLAGPDRPGNRAGRLIRVTADVATNYTTVVPNSEVVLLGTNSTWDRFNGFINSTTDLTAPPAGINPDGSYVQDFIASDSESHTVGSLAFSNDGALFVSIGDGASYNEVDPRAARVQDIDSLSGKVLRINPITGQGIESNPFYNGDPNSNRSKVYQSGLRNPFRINVNPLSGQLFVGDVGWAQWEEINSAGSGANFGWPYFEGGSASNLRTSGYQDLAEAQSFYNSGIVTTPSLYALNHATDGINAIVMGTSYTGSTYPAKYRNNVFFNDLGQGIVRAGTVDSSGRITSIEAFTTGARYVVQIFQGRDGNLYFVDLDDGIIARWVFVAQAPAVASQAQAKTALKATVAPPIASTNQVTSSTRSGVAEVTSVRNRTFLGVSTPSQRSPSLRNQSATLPPAPARTKSISASELDRVIDSLARSRVASSPLKRS